MQRRSFGRSLKFSSTLRGNCVEARAREATTALRGVGRVVRAGDADDVKRVPVAELRPDVQSDRLPAVRAENGAVVIAVVEELPGAGVGHWGQIVVRARCFRIVPVLA